MPARLTSCTAQKNDQAPEMKTAGSLMNQAEINTFQCLLKTKAAEQEPYCNRPFGPRRCPVFWVGDRHGQARFTSA
jgi:hypothetical protein